MIINLCSILPKHQPNRLSLIVIGIYENGWILVIFTQFNLICRFRCEPIGWLCAGEYENYNERETFA